MIVVGLCGGLGNQLFQYATARRLAQARQTDLVLDLAWYERTPKSDTPRSYDLRHYPIRARLTTPVEALRCRLHHGVILRRVPFLPGRWRHYRERHPGFDPAVLALHDDVYLDGYWQSHLYFEDIADSIRQELTPRAPFSARDQEVADVIVETDAVAVHVRRGDYVTHRAATQTLGLCSPEYYARAFSHIAEHVVSPHFVVFSDDPDWASTGIAFPGPATFVRHNGAANAFQDLRLMSLCRHQIIANSSFSWWGAWLNSNPSKVVTMPRQWFVNGQTTSDFAPETWVRL